MAGIVRALRVASVAMCAVVVLSFAIFVVDQTRTASAAQSEQIAGAAPGDAVAASTPAAGASTAGGGHASSKGSLHRTIDDVAEGITAPFSGIVDASNGEWAVRGAKLGLALLVYGFGLGYMARALRVHA